jgi:hypothetical protein
MLLQMLSGLTEWQMTTLVTSMSGSCGRIHLLGEENPKFNAKVNAKV